MASVTDSALAAIAAQLGQVMGALEKQVGAAPCTLFFTAFASPAGTRSRSRASPMRAPSTPMDAKTRC